MGDTMDRPWGHCAKWNKSDRERQMLYDLTYMWIKKTNSQNQWTDWWLPESGCGGGEMNEG